MKKGRWLLYSCSLSLKKPETKYDKRCKHTSYAGRRIRRGLFISSSGIMINADINGSLNIMRLGIEKQNVKLDVVEEILRPENKMFMLNFVQQNKRFVLNPVRICA